MNINVLITGAAGFIGTNLTAELLKRGCRVIGLDSFLTGKRSNIAGFLENKNYHFIEQDVIEPVSADSLPFQPDWIFNLACPASPVHYQADPVHTMLTCVQGAVNVLELASVTGARILQASTSEVYGEPAVHPQTESYRGNVNPCGIRSCYDEGKRAAEALFFDYHRKYGTDIRVVRIFNTYGPFMSEDDGRVVSNFISEALKGKDITIYGDGSQTRSFCYVSDLIEGFIRFMSLDNVSGPMNLGNPHENTVRELAELVIRQTGSSSRICYKDLPADDPTHRCPDISLAQAALDGWTPKVPVEEGIARTIGYFRSLYEAEGEPGASGADN